MHFGKNFKLHQNLDLKDFSLKIFPKYCQEIIYRWSKYLSSPPFLPSSIACQFLWLNLFKTLALAKIIHLALVTNVPTATIEL